MLTLAATTVLAACASATASGVRTTVASEGEVATPTVATTSAAGRAAALRPISFDELVASRGSDAPARAFASSLTHSASSRPLTATPATRVTSAAASPELWRGTYEGGTYSGRGALALFLGTDSKASGVVAWRVAPQTTDAFRGGSSRSDAASLVRVPVVAGSRDSTGRVVLHLDSYFDPTCHCTVRATFRGLVRGDTLSGRFSVDGAATVVSEQRGRWRAVRVRAEQ